MAAIQVNIRIPEVLLSLINSAAGEGKRSEWILEACRMRLDSGRGKAIDPSAFQPEDIGPTPTVHFKPDMQALRAICAGKPVAQGTATTDEMHREMLREGIERGIYQKACSYREWDGDSGRTMACGLPEHSPKQRHGNWRVLDA
jgi:hypothetical protein